MGEARYFSKKGELAFIRDYWQQAMDDSETNERLCGEIVKRGLEYEDGRNG